MDGFYRSEGLAGVEHVGQVAESVIRSETGSRRSHTQVTKSTSAVVTWHSGLAVDWSRLGVFEDHKKPASLALKRLIDIVGSLVALVALAPLLMIVAIIIKISSRGPVFFRQAREGLNGQHFSVLKFRSMHVELCDATGVAHTVDDDPRITWIGRIIRKTSIDELPQLFNVLAGDMSLVGPRPHVPGMLAAGQSYRQLVSDYDERLRMRPGITGWAQANGLRGSASNARKARERIYHDIAYVQNFSLWLDVKIMVKTVAREFLSGTGS